MRLTSWLDDLPADVRFTARQLRAAPGFTVVAALTLALGIGANSAIFALVDATVLRPLPFHEPERLVAVWERTDRAARGMASPLNMLDWMERTRSFEQISGFTPNVAGMVMSGAEGVAETVSRQWVAAGIFDVLGVAPIAGRTFHTSDNEASANLMMLSEGFWRARFGGDPTIVGRGVRFDGEPYTVVGVMPRGFQLLGETSMWGLRRFPRIPQMRRAYALQAVGRLKPGVTLEQAQVDITAAAASMARDFPGSNTGRSVVLEPLHDAFVGGELRRTSMLFLGVVGFVLLICCANVANLLLARVTARERELTIRSAIGANRGRIVRQLVTEGLVLGALGAALGAAVGATILGAAPSLIPEGLLPAALTLRFEARVVGFCGAAALAVGLVFGLAPARRAIGLSLTQGIAGVRGVTTRGGVGGLLVVAEVAAAVLLLFGAGLLVRTLFAVDGVDRGYRAEGVVTMMVDPLGSQFSTTEGLLQFYEQIEREVMGIPGVRRVGWTTTLPLGGAVIGPSSFEIVGDPPPGDGRLPIAAYQSVSPAYFETLDLALMAGRAFADRDTTGGTPVCIVSEAFVRRHLGGRSPIGLQLALRPAQAPQARPLVREIVGVAHQVTRRPDEAEDVAQVYVPLAQHPLDDIFLAVAPQSARLEGLAASVRGAIGRVDKAQLVSVRDVMTLEDVAWRASSRHRFRAVLVLTFAGLALLLAMVGVFGVIAYTVQQRTREFGVRIALGASRASVLGLVCAGAARLVTAGAAVGLLAAAALARTIAVFLFGVRPLDPATFATVALALAAVSSLAVAVPALRAMRVDPVVTFRSE